MSTKIETITGRYEASYLKDGKLTSNYVPSQIQLNRFSGGKQRVMLQITIYNRENSAYVQLTKKQVQMLKEALGNSFDINKYPNE